jgi:hypothetical protein
VRWRRAKAQVVAWTVGKAFEVTLEVVRGALEAGATLVQLVGETLLHPGQAMDNLIRAARQLGQTMKQVVDAFQQAGEEFIDELVRTVVAIGENIKDMLVAVLEVAVGALDTVIFQLMNFLNGFRALTTAERADAQLVFGTTVDLDHGGSRPTRRPTDISASRLLPRRSTHALVTGNHHLDADDLPIKRYQFIHEMTDAWQNQNVGPVYMGHALFSQGDEATQPTTRYNTGDAVTLTNANMTAAARRTAAFATGEGGQDVLTLPTTLDPNPSSRDRS